MGRTASFLVAVVLILIGLVCVLFPRGVSWLGRLPGDIRIERQVGGTQVRFYFPLVTCLIFSAILTLIFWLLGRR